MAAVVELVAKGYQDKYLISPNGDSVFGMKLQRHTNFAQAPKKLNIVGQISSGATVTVPIETYGDLINGLWFEGENLHEQLPGTTFSLYIGGQLIDSHTWEYISDIWQVYLADSWPKACTINNRVSQSNPNFLPMHFFFCEHGQFLPILAFQYHHVEIRVKFGSSIDSSKNLNVYGNYIWLDTEEREVVAKGNMDLLITQVQRITKPEELTLFNHPCKCIFFGKETDGTHQYTFDTGTLYLNGSIKIENMTPTYFHTVQIYYNTYYGVSNLNRETMSPEYSNFYMYSFADNSTKYAPTGECNFSRLDSAKLDIHGGRLIKQKSDGTIEVVSGISGEPDILYAVNYNVLRIEKGMGGVLFSS